MARSNRIQQIYGYLVCLIAIITLLIAVSSLIGAIFDLNRPTQADRGMMMGYMTYDAFRSQQINEAKNAPRDTTATGATLPADSTIERRYKEAKAAQQSYDHWQAVKSIVTSSIMIIVALILFIIHWRWLRRLDDQPEDGNG
jgi:hypothetical protein